MSLYTSQDQVASYLKRALTDDEVVVFNMLAEAACAYIDNELETTFTDTDTATDRYYDGENSCELIIDPAKTISAVYIIDRYGSILQTLQSYEFVAVPLNKNIKTSLRTKGVRFPSGVGNIKVTGKYTSYDNGVPAPISLATAMLVGDYLRNADTGDVKMEETEGWKVQYGNMPEITARVENLIAPYRRLMI